MGLLKPLPDFNFFFLLMQNLYLMEVGPSESKKKKQKESEWEINKVY